MMKVIVRCTWNGCEYKVYDYTHQYVFIPRTLIKWAEMTCLTCGKVGLEIYVTDEEEKEQKEQEKPL